MLPASYYGTADSSHESRHYSEKIDIPAMGYDEDLNTAGYCDTGDMVRFKLFKPSTGELFDLVAENVSPWEDNLIDIITSMSINYGDFAYGYELSDVYPNPFNPSTTINFTVSESIDLV